MLRLLFSSPKLCQAAILASASFLFLFLRVSPVLTIDINTYGMAAQRLFSDVSLYAPPEADFNLFNYPPFMALLFAGIIRIARLFPNPTHVVTIFLWVYLNAFVFWVGIARWHDFRKKENWHFSIALFACFIELDRSLHFYQVNGAIAGIMLIALDDFRNRKELRSGAWLGLGTAMKIYPVALLPFLLVSKRPRALVGITAFGLFAFLSPALIVGLGRNWSYHMEWLRIFMGDVLTARSYDLRGAFYLLGHHGTGKALAVAVAGITFLLLVWFAREPESIPWPEWFAVAVSALLLLSPRTAESTFVLIAPAFVLLAPLVKRPGEIAWMATSAGLLWFGTRAAETHGEAQLVWKTFGALAIWGAGVALMTRKLSYSGISSRWPRPRHAT